MNRIPTLGPRLRAARLGWGYSPQHGAFVRMSNADGANFRIELCPPDAVPATKSPDHGNYRVWWEGESPLPLIPWLRPVRLIKRYVSVVVGDDGAIVRSETP